jgi:3D (Asp-Asp-Asp) domain-containing protein
MLLLQKHVVILPTTDTFISPRILDNPKYATYFTDCIGALDGTHIDVYLPPQDQARYRNRKGHLSQNVLAACNFELQFTYILSG